MKKMSKTKSTVKKYGSKMVGKKVMVKAKKKRGC